METSVERLAMYLGGYLDLDAGPHPSRTMSDRWRLDARRNPEYVARLREKAIAILGEGFASS